MSVVSCALPKRCGRSGRVRTGNAAICHNDNTGQPARGAFLAGQLWRAIVATSQSWHSWLVCVAWPRPSCRAAISCHVSPLAQRRSAMRRPHSTQRGARSAFRPPAVPDCLPRPLSRPCPRTRPRRRRASHHASTQHAYMPDWRPRACLMLLSEHRTSETAHRPALRRIVLHLETRAGVTNAFPLCDAEEPCRPSSVTSVCSMSFEVER